MTFGAPSGAFGGSNGDQSGTESRMSTLTLPLKASLIVCSRSRGRAAARMDGTDARRGGRAMHHLHRVTALASRTHDAAKPDVPSRRVDRLRLATRRAVAQAVVGRAQVR